MVYIDSAEGCVSSSRFLLFMCRVWSTESFTMPSYLSLCSGSRVFSLMSPPSRKPITASDSFLDSVRMIEVGQLGSEMRWKV